MEQEIKAGCWLDTERGLCVCTKVAGETVHYRYSAYPCSNGEPEVLKQIWVECVQTISDVSWASEADMVSMAVVKLNGVYGTD